MLDSFCSRKLTSVFQALTGIPDRGSGKFAFIPLEQQMNMAHDGLYYLHHESTPDGLLHSDFNTSLAVANMVMQGAEIQPSLLQNLNVGVIRLLVPLPNFTNSSAKHYNSPCVEHPRSSGAIKTVWGIRCPSFRALLDLLTRIQPLPQPVP